MMKTNENLVFEVSDSTFFTDFTRSDMPERRWELSFLPLLGRGAEDAGLFIRIDVFDRAERVSTITLQWDQRGRALRLGFFSRESHTSVQIMDLRDPSPIAALETSRGSFIMLYDRTKKQILFPGSTSSTFPVPCVVSEAIELTKSITPVSKKLFRADRMQIAEAEDGSFPTVIYKPANGNDKCDRDRKTGWGKVVGELLVGLGGALAVGLTGGIGALVVGGVGCWRRGRGRSGRRGYRE